VTYCRAVVHQMFSNVNTGDQPRQNNLLPVMGDTLQYTIAVCDIIALIRNGRLEKPHTLLARNRPSYKQYTF